MVLPPVLPPRAYEEAQALPSEPEAPPEVPPRKRSGSMDCAYVRDDEINTPGARHRTYERVTYATVDEQAEADEDIRVIYDNPGYGDTPTYVELRDARTYVDLLNAPAGDDTGTATDVPPKKKAFWRRLALDRPDSGVSMDAASRSTSPGAKTPTPPRKTSASPDANAQRNNTSKRSPAPGPKLPLPSARPPKSVRRPAPALPPNAPPAPEAANADSDSWPYQFYTN